MYKALNIKGFRCFDRLSVRELSRINLFVGLNNCGKTSVLEAVHTLARCGEPQSLEEFMTRRHELISTGRDMMGRRLSELDIKRLFLGHTVADGSLFEIAATNGHQSLELRVKIESEARRGKVYRSGTSDPVDQLTAVPPEALWFDIQITRNEKAVNGTTGFRLSRLVGIDPIFTLPDYIRQTLVPVESVSIDAADGQSVADAWSKIALTADESAVVATLQVLDDTVERVAYVHEPTNETGTFVVKTKRDEYPIPVGSLGAGTWRVLTLAVALARAKDGILLVDEIDTGIHHAAMGEIWRTVLSTAEKLNVQVFATTHSLDCIRGLAQVCRDDLAEDGSQDRISMHRIERDRPESVHYSERQILIAADEGIETR